MMNVLKCYTNDWCRFSGRANRKTYWLFYISFLVILFILHKVEQAMGLKVILPITLTGTYDAHGMQSTMQHTSVDRTGLGWPSLVFYLYCILPLLSAAVRRLHDSARSGWWVLIGLIPVLGWIWFFVLLCTQWHTWP